jgi:hypothetical protein
MSDPTVVEAPLPKGPRFSGHESFACRYAWLPKAYRSLHETPALFSNEEQAMLELGIGKNMVRSLRFWVEVMGVAEPEYRSRRLILTEFGHAIFGSEGFDPYLEDPQTLWLLHWMLSSRSDAPLFAWDYMLGHWSYPEFTRTEALAAFGRESDKRGLSHSDVTLAQHLDVFLHTYLSARGPAVGVEDSLDGPLVDLHLLLSMGDRRNEVGRWETVYGFRREPKPDISAALFDYCLMDFWDRFSPLEETLTLRRVALAPCSPGQVFKLSEDDVRTRLEERSEQRAAAYAYQPSAVQGLLTRQAGGITPTLAHVFAGAAQ